MDVRAFALRLVNTSDLSEKLEAPPTGLPDATPGPPLVLAGPGRPDALAIRSGPATKVPPLAGMADPAQRVRILHAFANHELQAAELFAWALLAFPDAPAELRRGLLGVLADEQRHARMYIHRMQELGAHFGDWPVSGYFWSKIAVLATPLEFLCAMCLTFENANLDHAVDYAAAARDAGDPQTAEIIDRVHADERRHVRFGLQWAERLAPSGHGQSQTYLENVAWPLRPELARGRRFHPEARAGLGFAPDFLALLGRAGRS